MGYQPRIGAWLVEGGAAFRVWAPEARRVTLVLEGGGRAGEHTLAKDGEHFHIELPDVRPGQQYRFRVDDNPPFPDPASRHQPQGVHGPSELVNLAAYSWHDESWRGLQRDRHVFYEVHVGAFSPEGTFEGVRRRLELLRKLGVTAIELMPIADFPGRWNWGYDGVSPFAPARCYGRPEELQRLVDSAHGLGLAVVLDVVYNHLGPDGNYTGVFSPHYLTSKHKTPWGDALNFDGPKSRGVRDFFIENALHWLHSYHLDGLRLDATHAILDDGPRHFLAELSERVRQEFPQRAVFLFAEDSRNLAAMVRPVECGGWGLDGVWADDFHHEMRRLLAGDSEGYYRDYQGDLDDLATGLNKGWLYCGQHSQHRGGPRGSDPAGLEPWQFVFCLQNHDQVGNRALGDRLHHVIELAAYRAATAVLLTAPQTPLLFMGQEWACSTPFCFFTDHQPELGRRVTEGRRDEFKQFQAFAHPELRAKIPDPQAEGTFRISKLKWEEREEAPHRGVLDLYRALLALRKTEKPLQAQERAGWEAAAWDDDTLILAQWTWDGAILLTVARLRGAGLFKAQAGRLHGAQWQVLLHTEEETFGGDPRAVDVQLAEGIRIDFKGPAAVVLREARP